jgi:hypothetical protein
MPSYPNSKSWKIWSNGAKSLMVTMAPNVTYEIHEVGAWMATKDQNIRRKIIFCNLFYATTYVLCNYKMSYVTIF